MEYSQDNRGNIFVFTFGYDCTIATFVQIIRETAKTVTVREIPSIVECFDLGVTEMVMPNQSESVTENGNTKTWRASKHAICGGRTVSIKSCFGNSRPRVAELWDGKPVRVNSYN